MSTGLLRRSPLDEARWGVPSARASLETPEELDGLEVWCREQVIRFLVVRIPTTRLHTVQEAERRGFFLTGTLLWLRRDLCGEPLPVRSGSVTIRQGGARDADEVSRVAREAFRGYGGHYHADPRIDPRQADEVYTDWARRGCLDAGTADRVLVAETAGKIVGFGLIVLRNNEVGDGTLYGVHPESRGRGIYRELVVEAMHWVKSQGRCWMLESTQVTNTISQKVWAGLGFEPFRSEYTLHRWFE